MTFKLRSGNTTPFKKMGSSPAKQDKLKATPKEKKYDPDAVNEYYKNKLKELQKDYTVDDWKKLSKIEEKLREADAKSKEVK